MKHYIVTGRVFEIPANARVEITPEQYAARKHALKSDIVLPAEWERAVFFTLAPIQFKQGEQVKTDLAVGKAQMVEIIPVKEGSDPALVVEEAKKSAAPAKPAEKQKKGFFGIGR